MSISAYPEQRTLLKREEALTSPCSPNCSQDYLNCLGVITGLTFVSGIITIILGFSEKNPVSLGVGIAVLCSPCALICLKISCCARGYLQDYVQRRNEYFSIPEIRIRQG